MNAVYSKDGNGRIVSMLTKASANPNGVTKVYAYNNGHELTAMTKYESGQQTADNSYLYDNAGRLTKQVQTAAATTTFNYEWDAGDRMTKVQKVAAGVTKTINYAYNAVGLRARRVDTSTNVTKLWTYAGNNIASVSTKSGGSFGDTSTQEWVYTVGPGMINNVLERHKANYAATTTTSEFYQYDHRGNVAAVTDYSGKILRGYQYDAFGNIPFSFATGQSGAAPTDDILFTGKDLDPDTGLYYFNARWLDSDTGRFLSKAGSTPDSEHPYTLSNNSPIMDPDPTGLDPERDRILQRIKDACKLQSGGPLDAADICSCCQALKDLMLNVWPSQTIWQLLFGGPHAAADHAKNVCTGCTPGSTGSQVVGVYFRAMERYQSLLMHEVPMLVPNIWHVTPGGGGGRGRGGGGRVGDPREPGGPPVPPINRNPIPPPDNLP